MGSFGWLKNQPDFTVPRWKTLFTLSQIPPDSSSFLQTNGVNVYFTMVFTLELLRSWMATSIFVSIKYIMAPFAGLDRPDQPADPPHISLFIKPAKQCFSLTQPTSFSQNSASRTGPKSTLTKAGTQNTPWSKVSSDPWASSTAKHTAVPAPSVSPHSPRVDH